MKTATDLGPLVGSGDRIALRTLPFAVVGVIATLAYPSLFDVGGPGPALRALSIAALIVGVAIWAWSVVLILEEVPKGHLITRGPFAVVKHPLYTSVSLLVLPSIGFLLDTWVGALIGIVMYIATRRFAPDEEEELSARFGEGWARYRDDVKIPWL
ncbi:MAG TPA: isoprenylcysteine carboxylmethyltransferase family protein [Actinomycetota bacterium]|nr:isoprenylcysteine carboxylmethyltransferase family protein [Actinomycetota bacterium]